MYTLKSIARRGTLLGAVAGLLVAAVAPASPAFADALNPLTERSLLLSSSAPGFVDTDGSGNSNAAPNSINENYAPAGSGPNGKKTGETFTFKMSSASATIRGFSLQYCTTAAGLCQAPGNNGGDSRDGVAPSAYPSGNTYDGNGALTNNSDGRETNAQAHPQGRSDFDVVGDPSTDWDEGTSPGSYQIRISTDNGVNWSVLSGWTMTAAPLQSATHTGPLTGKNNYITLTNASGPTLTGGTLVEIRFRPSETVYLTNPGSNEFFVKINTYSSNTSLIGDHNDPTPLDTSDHTVVDGGVTVANVMTDSIHITTKVLETMSFSVGTQNPDTVELSGAGNHGTCDTINTPNNNRLSLGDPNAEYSLQTTKAWDVYSYWRLSSNSSGGAAVYYSGDTLRNTVGDFIKDMPIRTNSNPGSEQFGLGFVDAGPDTIHPGYAGDDVWDADYVAPRSYPFITVAGQATGAPYDTLPPQTASADYDGATGSINGANPGDPGTAEFKFLASSLTVPELIAEQNNQVISCATAKMRYVGNIAADTPAGVYTTKINYLAAPQY